MTFALRRLFFPVALPLALLGLLIAPVSQQLAAQGKKTTTTTAKSGSKTKAKRPVKKSARSKAQAARKGPPPTPAKTLFGAAKSPAPLAARAIGFYAKGCLSGGKAIPIDGPAWQVMRLSRNRNWGHPRLISLIERLAVDVKAQDGWNGLMIGDISQPRGGPMLTGHASHQIGLDADIWLTPMPDKRLTRREREDLSATSMLGADRVTVDPKIWTEAHGRLILRAASYSQVERVLVNPGIKKALCENKAFPRMHLNKVRPYWGHHYHMHVRLFCPKDSPGCTPQGEVGSDDGCGKELDTWIKLMQRVYGPRPPVDPKIAKPKPKPKPQPKKPEITLADLPAACKLVIGNTSPPGPSPVSDVTKPEPEAAETDDKPETSDDKPAETPAVAGKK